MQTTHLTTDQKEAIINAYEDKDFQLLKKMCFEYKTMVGCGNCEYSHDLAVLHVEKLIQESNE